MSTIVFGPLWQNFADNLGSPVAPPTLTQDPANALRYLIKSGYSNTVVGIATATKSGANVTSLVIKNPGGVTLLSVTGISVPPATIATIFLSFSTDAKLFYSTLVSIFNDNTTVTGSAGDERAIEVGAGNDTVNSGGGDDTVYKWKAGNLTFNGGTGRDSLYFEPTGAIAVTPIRGATVNLATHTGLNPFGGTLTLSGVEIVGGTKLTDDLRGDGFNNVLDGKWGGNDQIRAAGGDDVVNLMVAPGIKQTVFADGGIGNDRLRYSIASYTGSLLSILDANNKANNTGIFAGSTFLGFESYDFTYFAAGANLPGVDFRGTAIAETVFGTPAADKLNGNGGNDTLNGDKGDQLNGGTGNDRLEGRSGAKFDGGANTDTAVYYVWQFSGNITLSIADPNALVNLPDGSSFIRVEQIVFYALGTANFTITGGALADSFNGRDGNDVFNGGGGADVFSDNNGGNDVFRGGAGADELRSSGNSGTVLLDGGPDIDALYYQAAFGAPAITINLTAPAVQRTIVPGVAYVNIERISFFYGDAEVDTIIGGNFNDRDVYTQGGNDKLTGNGGDDGLYSGSGNDTVSPGAGKDLVDLGSGTDILIFNTVPNTATNKDTVYSFDPATDQIRLLKAAFGAISQAVAPNTLAALQGQFYWESTTGLAHDPNDRIIYNLSTGVLSYDSNGNVAGGIQEIAFLYGKPNISVADIFLAG